MAINTKQFELYVDTAGLDIILELRQVGVVADRLVKKAEKKQSELLLGLVKEMLNKHKLELQDIAKISANPGPGRFTSLRVGIATVNAINFALGRKEFIKPNYGKEPNITLRKKE